MNEIDNLPCVKCGVLKEDHCDGYEPPNIPSGCICDPHEWGDICNIPDICDKFEPFIDDPEYCKNCQHEKQCHDNKLCKQG